jgi:hypothetical protein
MVEKLQSFKTPIYKFLKFSKYLYFKKLCISNYSIFTFYFLILSFQSFRFSEYMTNNMFEFLNIPNFRNFQFSYSLIF